MKLLIGDYHVYYGSNQVLVRNQTVPDMDGVVHFFNLGVWRMVIMIAILIWSRKDDSTLQVQIIYRI